MKPFINTSFKSAIFRWESRNFQILHLRELFILFKNNYFFKRKKNKSVWNFKNFFSSLYTKS